MANSLRNNSSIYLSIQPFHVLSRPSFFFRNLLYIFTSSAPEQKSAWLVNDVMYQFFDPPVWAGLIYLVSRIFRNVCMHAVMSAQIIYSVMDLFSSISLWEMYEYDKCAMEHKLSLASRWTEIVIRLQSKYEMREAFNSETDDIWTANFGDWYAGNE